MADDPGVIPLSRFNAVLGRARGMRRLEAILARPDAAAVVAELPVMDLYFLIKEVGLADAADLVALATPEQFQGCLDLDAWDHDQLREGELRPWLAALIDAGYARVAKVWEALDPELTALVIQRWTRIYTLAEEEVPDDEEPPFYPTPDRAFMVKITCEDDADVRLVERLLDDLYRADAVLARHVLRSAASEPAAELEEQSYRWRSGRMQDLGYADYHEALEVYRPIDLGAVKIGEGEGDHPPPSTLPAVLAEPTLKHGFLGEVLARVVEPEEARRIEAALVMLFNRVLSADRVDPGDPEAAAAGAARAAATLSLGLETLARGNPERGADALRTVSLTRLHRLGHSVTLQLLRLVEALGARAGRAEEPLASVIAALASRRPAYPRVLDDPPGAGTRPFARAEDVRRVAGALGLLAAQVTLVFDVLAADPATRGAGVTLGDVGRTALCRAILGLPVTAAPVTVAEVARLVTGKMAGGRLLPEVRAGAEAALHHRAAERNVAAGPEFSPAIRGWMDDLEARLGRVDASAPLDRRFLDGLLLE